MIKNVLMDIVRNMFANTDEVVIEEQRGELAVTWEIHVHPRDVGQIIGKGGQTIIALRHVVTCMARNHRLRATVEIYDPHRDPNAA